ncbi:metallophosphoesterase [Nocardia macrotermitis]|uniref:3',5'-cyclic adenosine monophosphate phosphodiesterase CpdA n=1 Tax=Nocardia macrotermitis TaxID=2585198 RepID=A0A7K0CUN0_9NOCA|nr:metallophosphoesterase [Nocardia macrotermitis]MQY17148.1 3',5'-cyclic adenosine monophosphate phosphodiesterase CpdA [Nocardia macrotermitis]
MNTLTIIQLTDTHIRAAGELLHGCVDTMANLNVVLDGLRNGTRIDALVLSGDLTDNGSPEAYRRLAAAVEPVAAELGAAVVYAMGNHDERVAFGVELLGMDAEGLDPEQPHDSVVMVEGLRIVALDSSSQGCHNGHLDADQLEWLAAQLSTPAPRGTLLVLHHPPIPSANPAAEVLKLQRAEELAAVVVGTDVRMIVCGHNHFTAASSLAGIPVWLGPAVAYRLDPMAPEGRHRGISGFGYSRIDVVGSAFVATAVEATPVSVVYDRPQSEILAQLAASAAEQQ